MAYDAGTGISRTIPFGGEFAFLYALTPDLACLTDFQSNTFRFLLTTKFGLCAYDLKQDVFTPEYVYAGGQPLENAEALIRLYRDENDVFWSQAATSIVAFQSIRHTLGLLRNYHHDAPARQWSNRVIGLAEDGQGNVWFGGGNLFNQLDWARNLIIPHAPVEGPTDRLAHQSVRGMGWDGRYVVLGPTDQGVWLFESRTGQYRRPVYASDSVRTAVEEDFLDHLTVLRNGDIVVCGRFHVYRIAARTYRLDFLRFPGDDTNSNVALQDEQGRLWIGTNIGVYGFDEQYRLLTTTRT